MLVKVICRFYKCKLEIVYLKLFKLRENDLIKSNFLF